MAPEALPLAIFGAATTACLVAAYFDVANRGAWGFAAAVFGCITYLLANVEGTP